MDRGSPPIARASQRLVRPASPRQMALTTGLLLSVLLLSVVAILLAAFRSPPAMTAGAPGADRTGQGPDVVERPALVEPAGPATPGG